MKRLVVILAVLTFGSPCWAASERENAIERLDKSAKVLHEIMNAPDQRIPDHILRPARCIAVIPHLMKGGFVFGAEEGKGVATCRTGEGWSAPTFIQMGGGSWGTQFGVEAVDLVMVIRGRRGLQKLLSSKFEIGRDASVAVGPMGRHSSENTDAALNAVILTYSRAKGAFLGMTFDGAVVKAKGYKLGHAAGQGTPARGRAAFSCRCQGSESASGVPRPSKENSHPQARGSCRGPAETVVPSRGLPTPALS